MTNPIHFNIITPNGCYKSGSRLNSKSTFKFDKCLQELKASIREWNDNNPEDKFPGNSESDIPTSYVSIPKE
jgi:hypothetical protein